MRKCLLLKDQGERLCELVPSLARGGYEAVFASGDVERFCADEAQRGLALVGAGEGALRALLLAERYPVDCVVLIGCPLRPRGSSPLRRRAEHNLFCVVSDLLVVQPLMDETMLPRSADILLRGINSRRRARVDLGRDFADIWASAQQPLSKAVVEFLDGKTQTKALAKRGVSW